MLCHHLSHFIQIIPYKSLFAVMVIKIQNLAERSLWKVWSAKYGLALLYQDPINFQPLGHLKKPLSLGKVPENEKSLLKHFFLFVSSKNPMTYLRVHKCYTCLLLSGHTFLYFMVLFSSGFDSIFLVSYSFCNFVAV